VLYFEAYIVTEPGLTPLEKFQLLTEDELIGAQDEYGEDAFTAGIGAEAVKQMLIDLDLEGEKEDLLKELAETKSELKPKKIIKRLKVVESFLESGNRPEWMILDVVRSSRPSCARWCRSTAAASRRRISTTCTAASSTATTA
jgi:DNA-directed RNA polymerase subunit beta'